MKIRKRLFELCLFTLIFACFGIIRFVAKDIVSVKAENLFNLELSLDYSEMEFEDDCIIVILDSQTSNLNKKGI